jgi:hypothetical protein
VPTKIESQSRGVVIACNFDSVGLNVIASVCTHMFTNSIKKKFTLPADGTQEQPTKLDGDITIFLKYIAGKP